MNAGLQIGDVRIAGRVLMAPMTGITDLPFRVLASRLGAAYVATEMVACDEFAKGRPDVVRRAAVGEGLPLMVVQLVGHDPAHIAKGARLAAEAGAQIIDLNFGCPAKEVTGLLSGSALMRNPEQAERLVAAAVDAVFQRRFQRATPEIQPLPRPFGQRLRPAKRAAQIDQTLRQPVLLLAGGLRHAQTRLLQPRRQIAPHRHRHFGGGRRRRRAPVGGEVDQRGLGFMPYRRDQRDGAVGSGADNDFLVEAP